MELNGVHEQASNLITAESVTSIGQSGSINHDNGNGDVAGNLSTGALLTASNVRNIGETMHHKSLTDMSVALQLPKAAFVKKKVAPVDEWEVVKDLKGNLVILCLFY
jgi:hypothetical protein